MGILVALPIAAAIAVLDRKKIEDFFFLAIGIIIMCILMSGYALGNTVPGVVAGVGVGLISALYCIVVFFIERERFKNCVLTPGFGVMLVATVVSGVIMINKTDLGGANDTYWAHIPQVLNMYRNSNIGNVGRVSVNYSLLYTVPVCTSWCYFCNVLWPSYSDGINLWARQLFIMAAFMPFFTFTGKREWKKILLISLVVMLIPGMIGPQYDFMLDIPMGAMMIYGTVMLLKLFRNNERYNDGWYLLGGGICLLFTYLMKRMGGVYAFSMIGLVVVYSIDRIRAGDRAHSFWGKLVPLTALLILTMFTLYFNGFRNKILDVDILVTLLPFCIFPMYTAMGILCYLIRQLFQKKRYLAITVILVFLYTVVLKILPLIAGKAREMMLDDQVGKIKEVFYDFFSMWFTSEPGEKRFGSGWFMPDIAFVIILLIIMLVIRTFISSGKLYFAGTVSGMDNVITVVFMGYTFYMLFYLFLCMYRQGDYASDGGVYWTIRYHGPAVMLVAAMVLYELLSVKGVHIDKILMCMAAFLMLLLPNNPFMILNLSSEPYWDLYNEMYKKAGVGLTEYDRVYCIGPDHVYYYSFPAMAYQDYEVIESGVEPEYIANRVKGYDYMIIEDCNRQFSETYQDLFEGGIDSIQDFSVYDIKNGDDGSVTFVKREAVN